MPSIYRSMSLAVAVMLTIAASAASATIVPIPVANPSFELPVADFPPCWCSFGPIPGWEQQGGGLSGLTYFSANGFGPTPDGYQSGFTTGGGGTGIAYLAQRIGTVIPGETYSLSAILFVNANDPTATNQDNELILGYNPGPTWVTFVPFKDVIGPGGNGPSGAWFPASITGVAPPSASGDLEIALGGWAGGVSWDSVALTAGVPELSTWAMMLIGFFAMGFIIFYRETRRRKEPVAILFPTKEALWQWIDDCNKQRATNTS